MHYGLLLILSLFIALDAYFAYFFKNPLSLGGVASIFETNSNEANEAIGAIRQIFFPAMLFISLNIFIVSMSKYELKKSKLSKKISILILSIYLGVLIPVCLAFIINKNQRLVLEVNENPVLTVQRVSLTCMPVFYNDLITIIAYKNEMRRFKQFSNIDRKLPKEIKFIDSKNSPEKFFLVIGESSWRKRYSLYGYSVPTTPF